MVAVVGGGGGGGAAVMVLFLFLLLLLWSASSLLSFRIAGDKSAHRGSGSSSSCRHKADTDADVPVSFRKQRPEVLWLQPFWCRGLA